MSSAFVSLLCRLAATTCAYPTVFTLQISYAACSSSHSKACEELRARTHTHMQQTQNRASRLKSLTKAKFKHNRSKSRQRL
eukprot:m.260272 g.260272  ORF g.260272 m.260272 type:complete len:81 (+) comp15557_c0_seq1:621-863(+)